MPPLDGTEIVIASGAWRSRGHGTALRSLDRRVPLATARGPRDDDSVETRRALQRRRLRVRPVHQGSRLGDLMDLEADVAVVAHEAVEVGLAQDEEPAIAE